MNDRQENLYAAPVSQTEDAAVPETLYLDWNGRSIRRAAVICGAMSGLFVLVCKAIAYSAPLYFSKAEWAVGSFAPVTISVAFVFGANLLHEGIKKDVVRASVLPVLVIAGLSAWNVLQPLVNNFAIFLSCHFLLPAAICRIRRVPIHLGKLLFAGIISNLAFYLLTFLAWSGLWVLSTVIFDPWDLYYYTQAPLLAFVWGFVASLACAFMLAPLPDPETTD